MASIFFNFFFIRTLFHQLVKCARLEKCILFSSNLHTKKCKQKLYLSSFVLRRNISFVLHFTHFCIRSDIFAIASRNSRQGEIYSSQGKNYILKQKKEKKSYIKGRQMIVEITKWCVDVNSNRNKRKNKKDQMNIKYGNIHHHERCNNDKLYKYFSRFPLR